MSELANIAFLSMDTLDDFECYDELAVAELVSMGWRCDTVSWRASGVDWSRYDAVVVRSCWDYQQDPQAFFSVLENIERAGVALFNSLSLMRWNLDKRYLQDLENQSVPIVPTRWEDAGFSVNTVAAAFDDFGCEQIILKPRISANADHTYRLHRKNLSAQTAQLRSVFDTRAHMIQPFVDAVLSLGECSLFYFNGTFSHAVRKTPKAGDFRVQEEHGGQIRRIVADAALMTAGTRVLTAVAEPMLYARVDMVPGSGGWQLMELELIEPSLYFNMDAGSAARFAGALAACLAEWQLRNGPQADDASARTWA